MRWQFSEPDHRPPLPFLLVPSSNYFVVVARVSVRVGISAEGSGGSGHGIEAHGGLGDGAMDGALGGRLGDGARGKERA
jgi:hypothetical protein